jgi:hypothetical protein
VINFDISSKKIPYGTVVQLYQIKTITLSPGEQTDVINPLGFYQAKRKDESLTAGTSSEGHQPD